MGGEFGIERWLLVLTIVGFQTGDVQKLEVGTVLPYARLFYECIKISNLMYSNKKSSGPSIRILLSQMKVLFNRLN